MREPRHEHGTRLLAAVVCVALVAVVIYWRTHPRPVSDVQPIALGYRVDVNHADADELQLLPSIGPARAEHIVTHRTEHGPFHNAAELQQVHTLGPRIVEGVEPYVLFE